MRVAIMSDVHGFDLAFQTVLEDIDRSGPFDEVVVAGDLCVIGPRPDEVVRIIRNRGLKVVQGNTDADLIEASVTGISDPEFAYAIERLGAEGIEFLDQLPFDIRLSPPGSTDPNEDLLIVHANPWNLRTALDPTLSDEELLEIIGPVKAAVIAFGHVHICYAREVGSYTLIDVSAVGNSKDHDLRCKYGVADWNPLIRRWTLELHKVPYPLDATKDEIRKAGVPSARKVIERLERAAYKGR